MKLSRTVIENAVMNKVKSLAFGAIVTECFMNAIPFDRSSFDMDTESNLANYCREVLEQLGGYKALESAIRMERNPQKTILLRDIDRICTEAAASVAKRIADENTGSDALSLEELVADSGFTKKEYKEFVTKADNLDLNEIADLIKAKVLATLKSEKEDHLRIETLNAEIRDRIKEDDDDLKEITEPDDMDSENMEEPEESTEGENTEDGDSDEADEGSSEGQNDDTPVTDIDASEAFVKIVTGKRDSNVHNTLFSSIQSAACEQIIHTENMNDFNADEIDIDRIKRITFENTFIALNRKKSAMEALNDLCNLQSEEIQNENLTHMNEVMEAAMIDSVITYTMLESLYTLNLMKVNVTDARMAIENSLGMRVKTGLEKKAVLNELKNSARAVAMESVNALKTVSECNARLFALRDISTKLHETMESIAPVYIEMIDNHCAAIESRIEDIRKSRSTTQTKEPGYYDKLRNRRNIAQMDKIASMARLVGPRVSEIVIEQSIDNNSYDVHINQRNGQVMNTFITLESVEPSDVNAIRRIAELSKLKTSSMDVYLKTTDGRGRKIHII